MISSENFACAGGAFPPPPQPSSLSSQLFPPPYPNTVFGVVPPLPALQFVQNQLVARLLAHSMTPTCPSRFHKIENLLAEDSKSTALDAAEGAPQPPVNPVRSRKRKKRTQDEPPVASAPAEKKRKAAEQAIVRLQAVKEKEPSLLPPDLSNCLPSGNSPLLDGVRVEMDEEWANLWREFDKDRTEMIVTRAGSSNIFCLRRFYPVVKVRLEGCDPSLFYYVMLDVVPVDGCRYQYRYCKSRWKNAGKADPPPPYCLFLHPDSPFTSRTQKASATYSVQFDKAKLTNLQKIDRADQSCQRNHIILNSMHKYQVRIHVLALDQPHLRIERFTSAELSHFLIEHPHLYRTYEFPYTKFFAVTAYQNGLVKQLKIKYNPFAKGFRFRDKDDIGHLDSDHQAGGRGNYHASPPTTLSTASCGSTPSAEMFCRLANDLYNSIGRALPSKAAGRS